MHGITDNHTIINRNTWVNGIEWKLNPEDLKTWNLEKIIILILTPTAIG